MTRRGVLRLIAAAGWIAVSLSAPAQGATFLSNANVTTGAARVTYDPVSNRALFPPGVGSSLTLLSGLDFSAVTVPVGPGPGTVALHPVAGRAFVVNSGAASVSIVDLPSAAVVATVAVAPNPFAAVCDPLADRVYVSSPTAGLLTVIHALTGAVLSTVAAGAPGSAEVSLAVDPISARIYAANPTDQTLYVVDTSSGALVATAALGPPGPVQAYGMVMNPQSGKAYAANASSAVVTRADAAGATLAMTGGGGVSAPFSLAGNPLTNRIFDACGGCAGMEVFDGATDSWFASITSGNVLGGVSASFPTNVLAAVDASAGQLLLVDGATNTLSAAVPVAANPVVVTMAGATDRYYTAHPGTAQGGIVDGARNTVLPVGVGATPVAVAVDDENDRVYVANGGSAGVTVLQASTSAILATVALASNPRAVAVNSVDNEAYVVTSGGQLHVISGVSLGVTGTFAVGGGAKAVAANPLLRRAYTANESANTVSAVNVTAGTVATAAVGAGPRAIAWDPDSHEIWVVCAGAGTLVALDPYTLAPTTIAVGSGPAALALVSDLSRAYVANAAAGTVSVVNTTTNAAVATIVVGSNPLALAANRVLGHLYVANYGSGSVSVVDIAANGVVATIPAGSLSMSTVPLLTLASAERTGKVYLGAGNALFVADGASKTSWTVPLGASANGQAVAYDAVRGKVYVCDAAQATVHAVTETAFASNPLSTTINPVAGAVTNPQPSFSGSTLNGRAPFAGPVTGIYYQFDSVMGPWRPAAITSGAGTTSVAWQFTPTAPLPPGDHTLFVMALDATSATLDVARDHLHPPFVGGVRARKKCCCKPAPATPAPTPPPPPTPPPTPPPPTPPPATPTPPPPPSATWTHTRTSTAQPSPTDSPTRTHTPTSTESRTATGTASPTPTSTGTPLPLAPPYLILDRNELRSGGAPLSIAFAIEEDAQVLISAYNTAGEFVGDLWSGTALARHGYEIRWGGSDRSGRRLASGVYVLRLFAPRALFIKKVAVLG